jgi:hypothetical protein
VPVSGKTLEMCNDFDCNPKCGEVKGRVAKTCLQQLSHRHGPVGRPPVERPGSAHLNLSGTGCVAASCRCWRYFSVQKE